MDEVRNCGTCKHRKVQQLPPPNIGSVGVCMFLPPTPCVAFGQAGGQIGVVAQITARPQVAEADLCSQWEGRETAALIAAND